MTCNNTTIHVHMAYNNRVIHVLTPYYNSHSRSYDL
jgi:hypothetical protein